MDHHFTARTALLTGLLALVLGLTLGPAEGQAVPMVRTMLQWTIWNGGADGPEDPTDPEDPEDPEDLDSEDPSDSEDPADPEDVDDPEDPADPEDVDDPEILDNPDQPDEPDEPGESGGGSGDDGSEAAGGEGSGSDDEDANNAGGAGGGSSAGSGADGEAEDGDDKSGGSGSGSGSGSSSDDSGDDSDDDDKSSGSNSGSGNDDNEEDDDASSGSGSGSDDESEDETRSTPAGGLASADEDSDTDILDVDAAGALLEQVELERDEDGFAYRRGEIVAIDLDPAALQAASDLGFDVVQSFDAETIGATVYLLRARRDLDAPEAIALLRDAAPGASLGPNHLYYSPSADGRAKPVAGPGPSAPVCSCRIGMIDTALDPSHPKLSGVRVRQRTFAGDRAEPASHGVAVASLMFGRETGGSELYVADVFSGGGSRSGAATGIMRALDWLAASGAPVINISLAGPSNPAVEAMILRLSARGVVIVAAVGNDGPAAPPAYPAALAPVVAVTAVDQRGQIYRYAVRGDHVDFAAPGVDVTAAGPRGGYVQVTGTSFAAPVVAARIAAAMRKERGDKAVDSLKRGARDLGATGRDRVYGFGLVVDPLR